MPSLEFDGFTQGEAFLARETLGALRNGVFKTGKAGARCLLDEPLVREVAASLGRQLIDTGALEETAIAVQAIAFDKTPSANWKVTWHQDVMFPFLRRAATVGYSAPSTKDGLHYCRPPNDVLRELLAVRLHLDRCDASNGPLRVAPATHTYGILKSSDIPGILERHGEVATQVEEGGFLLMRPFLLHSSSKSLSAINRRALHLVFHSGRPTAEPWYRSVKMPDHSPLPAFTSGTFN